MSGAITLLPELTRGVVGWRRVGNGLGKMVNAISRGNAMKDILTVRQSEFDSWASTPSVGVCGNQTVEGLVERIEKSVEVRSDKPWDFYLWNAEGKRWGNDGSLLEECDRWHLSRYEVCATPPESKYQAVVILYYEPVFESVIEPPSIAVAV
jgi:hypothetical protein